jgi:hypothetical protein
MPAKKSGGPNTPEGKNIASKNALKYGFYSSSTLLPGESQEEFSQLEKQLMDDFGPTDILGADLVGQMATLVWKKKRFDSIENRVLLGLLNQPITAQEFSIYIDVSSIKDLDDAISQLHFVEENIELYAQVKKDAQYCLENDLTFDRLDKKKFQGSYFLDRIEELMREEKLKETIKQIDDMKRLQFGQASDPRFLKAAVAILGEAEVVIWTYENRDVLRDAIEKIKDQRLLDFMQSSQLSRAHDDMRRAFSKTLNELRTHLAWKRHMKTIDISLLQIDIP